MRSQTEPLEEAVRTLDYERFNNRREYLAVKFASHLADRPFRVSGEQIDELREEFTDGEIAEMAVCCGMFSWGNIVGIGLRVDLADHTHYPPLDWEGSERAKREQAIEDAERLTQASESDSD